MRLEFNQIGTFQALYAAEAWCRENGISVGQSSATGPTGLLFGSYGWIAKWRNLTPKERSELHGTMDTAILREKQLKKWNREWKLRLVQEFNPEWRDLWDDIVG